MVPGQEANNDKFRKFFLDFLYNNCMLSVLIRIAILMNTHNIQFYDKIRKKVPKYLFS